MSDSPTRVLLVDDVPGEQANFERAFGAGLTAVTSVDALNERLRSGARFDLAFVDFNLSSSTNTGLTALLRLRGECPEARVVTYSQFTESGRTLYAAAAKHWFEAHALLDKTRNHPETLSRYARELGDGRDPTPLGWQRRLRWASLIDNLIAEPSWVAVWHALRDVAGDMGAVAEMLHLEVSTLRAFKDRATDAAVLFNERFHDKPPPPSLRNKKGILSAFAAEHWQFLTAPDLRAVMSPGARAR